MCTKNDPMNEGQFDILTINGGSSSIKFSLYQPGSVLKASLHGKIEKIGTGQASLVYAREAVKQPTQETIAAPNMQAAGDFLIDWLEKEIGFPTISAVGHRIVHGLMHTEAVRITDDIIAELKSISLYDPDHLPAEIALVEKIRERYPQLTQVACFDTAFHAQLPRVARLFPIPRWLEKEGIRRYGFHGLSYSYLLETLKAVASKEESNGKLIFAHLGSGASLAAVKEGRCIDTSMGFTPTGGCMMSSRCGDIDPGILVYLVQQKQFTPQQLNDLVNHQSGLLGVSETSADMQELLQQEATDVRAAEAVELFCYEVKKWLGAFTGVLGGVDAVVFTGGIGENAPVIRARICEGLDYLGIQLSEKQNQQNEWLISSKESRVNVYVIPTDEEYRIAGITAELLQKNA